MAPLIYRIWARTRAREIATRMSNALDKAQGGGKSGLDAQSAVAEQDQPLADFKL